MGKRIDRESPEYRRELYIVGAIVTVLTLLGGTLLGYKIDGAEKAAAELRAEREQAKEAGETIAPPKKDRRVY